MPDVHGLLAAHPEIDLVVVAAPNAAAFSGGQGGAGGRASHVVVDKPFTLDAAEARELAALAKARGKIVCRSIKTADSIPTF